MERNIQTDPLPKTSDILTICGNQRRQAGNWPHELPAAKPVHPIDPGRHEGRYLHAY